MSDFTELVFILDRSGSMSGLESDTIGGFNSMLAKQKDGGASVLVSTVLFNHESKVIHDRCDIREIPLLTEKDYEPAGMTALLDAVGDAIKHIKLVHRYIRPEDVPARTMFVITTDGMENSSRKFSSNEVRALIEGQKKVGWEFIFLGANIDSVETARSIGISENRACNFIADGRGIRQNFDSIGDSTMDWMGGCNFSDDWKKSIDEDFKKRSGKKN